VVGEIEHDRPRADEVLVDVRAAGLCHSDLHYLDGLYPAATPIVLGHEVAGVVSEVGSAVTTACVGDHVVTCLSVYCGHCEYCLSGHPSLCDRVGVGRASHDPPRLMFAGAACTQFAGIGGFAERVLVHQHGLAVIPIDVPFESAALLGCGVLTGLGAVFRTARIEPGSRVAVVGCGGVGLSCVQGAVLAGASRVVAIDTNPGKLEMARQFGATDLIDASTADPVEKVRELFPGVANFNSPGGGVEYSFEAVGRKDTSELAFSLLRKGGTATVIGMIPFGVMVEVPGAQLLSEKKLQGSSMGSNRFVSDLPRYLDLYRAGRLKLDELVTDRLCLEDLNEGFAAMRGGTIARAVVVFE
jgi:S-(hydroxymethyl)glutathione dehydrogenase/alcohol dehydrogenase